MRSKELKLFPYALGEPLFLSRALAMPDVVTCTAYGYPVTNDRSKLGIIVKRLYVMGMKVLCVPAILTGVIVASKDSFAPYVNTATRFGWQRTFLTAIFVIAAGCFKLFTTGLTSYFLTYSMTFWFVVFEVLTSFAAILGVRHFQDKRFATPQAVTGCANPSVLFGLASDLGFFCTIVAAIFMDGADLLKFRSTYRAFQKRSDCWTFPLIVCLTSFIPVAIPTFFVAIYLRAMLLLETITAPFTYYFLSELCHFSGIKNDRFLVVHRRESLNGKTVVLKNNYTIFMVHKQRVTEQRFA